MEQYHNCDQIVQIYEAKKESKLQDFTEVSSNPFDSGQMITGIGNKKPRDRRQKERQKLLDRIDGEKD